MRRGMPKAQVMNRRPLVVMAVCFVPSIALGRTIQASPVYFAAVSVIAAAAVCLLLARKTKASFALFCAALALLGSFLASAAVHIPAMAADERTVKGHVVSTPYLNESGSTVCVLSDVTLDGQPAGSLKLYAPAFPQLKSGDIIETNAKIKTPDGVRNPGGFDERLYLASEGIWYKAYADTIMVTGYRVSAASALADVRAYLADVIDSVFPPATAPIAKGMLLGDKQSLDEDTYQAFKDTGMAHVLAVSGLHAAILIAAVYGFLRLIRLGRNATLIATLTFIAVYALVTGLTPSIVRASIMAAVMLLGKHAGRQTDTLSSLSLAFIISLMLSPLDLFMAGFQLSFAAVFGLLTVGAQLKTLLEKAMPWRLPDMISASVGATAGTMPVLAASFNRLSLLSILINIVVLPAASLAIVLVFITTLLGLIIGPAASSFAFAADAVISVMLTVIRALAVLPFAAFNTASPPWFITVALLALLFIISKYVLISTKIKAVLSVALSAMVVLTALLLQSPGMTVTFLDVGQGDASYIRTAQGGDYFVDGGPQNSADEVVSFAVRNGIAPDAAFVTHTDDDHFTGLKALYANGMLKKVYCSTQEYEVVAAAMPNALVVPLAAGDTIMLDDQTKAMVLYPYADSDAKDKNDLSLVLRIEYDGHSVLLAGDISGDTETLLFTGLAPADIYKAAHHGSDQSSYRLPLIAVMPRYCVVSVGENSFGHPGQRALKNLEYYSGEVYTTLQDHAVVFHIAKDITIQTYGD